VFYKAVSGALQTGQTNPPGTNFPPKKVSGQKILGKPYHWLIEEEVSALYRSIF
jgi:hypothetical protein